MLAIGPAALTAGGIAGLGYLVKSSLDAADAIGKTADAVGIHTSTLQEYQHAAEISGVNTAKLNSVFLAFSKRVGEARQNTGPLVTFLKKFDQTLLKNIQTARTTDQALELVFNRMGQITNQTDKAALANAAFSRSGIALTVMVKDGAAGLAKMRQEAQDLGIVLNDKVIRDSEAANDALTKLSATLKSSFTTVVTANIDTLTIAIEGLAGAMAWLGKQASAGRRIEELVELGVITNRQLAAFKRHASLGPKILAEGEARLKSYGAGATEHERLRLSGKIPSPVSGTPPEELKLLKLPTIARPPKIKILKNAQQIAEEEAEVYAKQFKKSIEFYGGDLLAPEIVSSQLSRMQQAFESTSKVIETTLTDTFDNASTALTDFLLGGEQNFSDFTNSILNDIARIGMQKVFSAGFESIFAGFKHAGGPVGSGLSKSVPASMFIGAPRLHKGLAPDEFPVIMQRGEEVIPKSGRRRAAGGGSNVEVFVNNYSGQPATVRESQGPSGMRQIFVMIGNDIKNGGPSGKAIEQTYNLRRSGRNV